MENFYLSLSTPSVPNKFRDKVYYAQVNKNEFFRVVNSLSKFYIIKKFSDLGKLTYYASIDNDSLLCEIGYRSLSD